MGQVFSPPSRTYSSYPTIKSRQGLCLTGPQAIIIKKRIYVCNLPYKLSNCYQRPTSSENADRLMQPALIFLCYGTALR